MKFEFLLISELVISHTKLKNILNIRKEKEEKFVDGR